MSGPPSRWKVTEVADLRGDRLILVHGELDIATAPRLAGLLTRLRERRHPVVLDLSEVAFMDSSGLNVLLDAHAHSRRDGWSFRIRRASPRVARIARLAGADELLD
jgi:anti-sigma B factor antagonist